MVPWKKGRREENTFELCPNTLAEWTRCFGKIYKEPGLFFNLHENCLIKKAVSSVNSSIASLSLSCNSKSPLGV